MRGLEDVERKFASVKERYGSLTNKLAVIAEHYRPSVNQAALVTEKCHSVVPKIALPAAVALAIFVSSLGGTSAGEMAGPINNGRDLPKTPIVVTTTRTPTPIVVTATPEPAPPATPDVFATKIKDVVDSVRSLRELKDELDDAFEDSSKKRGSPPPQPAPGPVIVPPNIIYVSPPPQSDSSLDGIRAAQAIETIVQGRINGKETATARAAPAGPVLTPTPLQIQVEIEGPVDVRIRDERSLPWWGILLLVVGATTLVAGIYANRGRIVHYIHTRTGP